MRTHVTPRRADWGAGALGDRKSVSHGALMHHARASQILQALIVASSSAGNILRAAGIGFIRTFLAIMDVLLRSCAPWERDTKSSVPPVRHS